MKNLRNLEYISIQGGDDNNTPVNDTILQVALLQKNLKYLYLGGFHFGAIPPELGTLTNLTSLNLPLNKFTGSIPKELENLTKLEDINLEANYLTGCVPKALYDKFGKYDFYQIQDDDEVLLPPCPE